MDYYNLNLNIIIIHLLDYHKTLIIKLLNLKKVCLKTLTNKSPCKYFLRLKIII